MADRANLTRLIEEGIATINVRTKYPVTVKGLTTFVTAGIVIEGKDNISDLSDGHLQKLAERVNTLLKANGDPWKAKRKLNQLRR